MLGGADIASSKVDPVEDLASSERSESKAKSIFIATSLLGDFVHRLGVKPVF